MNKTKLFRRTIIEELFFDYEKWLSANDVDIISTSLAIGNYCYFIVTYKSK